jgi:hypothetical protein
VLPVEKVYRIRTVEEDQQAVTPVGVPAQTLSSGTEGEADASSTICKSLTRCIARLTDLAYPQG